MKCIDFALKINKVHAAPVAWAPPWTFSFLLNNEEVIWIMCSLIRWTLFHFHVNLCETLCIIKYIYEQKYSLKLPKKNWLTKLGQRNLNTWILFMRRISELRRSLQVERCWKGLKNESSYFYSLIHSGSAGFNVPHICSVAQHERHIVLCV